MSSPIAARPKSDFLSLEIECSYSNMGQEWIASAFDVETQQEVFAAKGATRPDALRNLADELEAE